ncbi:hypothetical protein DL93DRAFT_2044105, partial [Clavulina sp. PMI_390]
LGLIGNDPKLAFRTQPSGIARLAEKAPIAETDDAYWSQYVLLFDSASDVYTLITPQDIRRALIEAPHNIVTLVREVSRRLKNLLIDHTFPSPPPSVLASAIPKFASSWGSSSGTIGAGERNPSKEVLNCLRVLGRILPVIFELPDDTFEEELFWKRQPVVQPPVSPAAGVPTSLDPAASEGEPQFVIDEDDDDDEDTTPTQTNSNATSTSDDPPPASAPPPQLETKLKPSLAEELFSYTIDLLFCCGFTIPTSVQVDHHKIQYVIWDKGIGSTTSIGSTSALDSAKTEVLRFLLILLSKTIYHAPNELLARPNKWTAHLVHSESTSRRLVLSILCSLLNTAMDHDGSGNAGGGVASNLNLGSMVERVPYNHLIMARKGEEGRSGLVGLCLGVLCVLLEYQVDDAAPPSEMVVSPGGAAGPTSAQQSNSFRFFLAKLHRTSDFDFVLDGILSILATDLANTANFLPGSRKPVPYILETFVFFWKMIELNKKFRAYLLESEKLLDVTAYLLCYCLENKDKPQHHGLCRALSYIMQSLSAEKRFGQQMQSPMPTRIPIPQKWVAIGTAADFFVSSIYSVVATTSGSLNSLYPALIIALANSAPYLQHLTVKSSNRLIHLFTAFSNPLFLLADDSHPRLVFFMLEALNGIIFHQLQENPNVTYALLRAHRNFEELGTFTLAKGLEEVRRVKLLKEEREAGRTGTGAQAKGKAPTTGPPPPPEKVSLLRTDSTGTGEEIFDAGSDDEDDEVRGAALVSELERASLRSPPRRAGAVGSDAGDSEAAMNDPTQRSGTPPSPLPPPTMSEKARGKMRARTSGSISLLDPELERLAAAGVGRNGFVPTQEWVTSWQQGLPLDPILLVISELLPKVMDMQTSLNTQTSTAVLQFLRSVSIQHVLPPPPPVMARRFQWSEASLVWLSSLIWGELYVHGTSYLGIWLGTNVRLFGVRQAPQQNRGLSMANIAIGGVG